VSKCGWAAGSGPTLAGLESDSEANSGTVVNGIALSGSDSL